MIKGLTLSEAVHKWTDEMNRYPQDMIQVLMSAKPDDWCEVTAPSEGDRVYVYDLPEETPDGKPYDGTEHCGEISDCFDHDTYRVALDDGNSVLVKASDFEVCFDDVLPMWGWMWSFDDSADDYWLEELGGIKIMSECGFRVYENAEWGYFFGIDGAGYDFYEAHWIPLYKKRGLLWHDTSKEGDKNGSRL